MLKKKDVIVFMLIDLLIFRFYIAPSLRSYKRAKIDIICNGQKDFGKLFNILLLNIYANNILYLHCIYIRCISLRMA